MGYGSGIAMSCGVGCRHGSDPALLWLWLRLAAEAAAPIQPLARKLPYASGSAPKRLKKRCEDALGWVSLVAAEWGGIRDP